jgi:hypothetical protein
MSAGLAQLLAHWPRFSCPARLENAAPLPYKKGAANAPRMFIMRKGGIP